MRWWVSPSSLKRAIGKPSRSGGNSWVRRVGRVRRGRRRLRRRERWSWRRRAVERRRGSSPSVSTLRLQCSPVGGLSAPCTVLAHPSNHPIGPPATAPKTTAGKMSAPCSTGKKTTQIIVYKQFNQGLATVAREAARQLISYFGLILMR